MNTPTHFTRTMAAGARSHINGSARFLTIYSVTQGVVVEFGFGDDALQVLSGPMTIDFGALGPGERFSRVVLRNADAVLPATVTGYWSNVLVQGTFSELTTLVAIQALLATIDADTGNLAAMLIALQHLTPPANEDTLVPAAIAITGGVADTILAARAGRKDLWFESPLTNVGDVYMGFDNAVSDANYARRMPPGAVWWPRWTGAIYATSENGTEVLHGYESW